MRAVVVTGSGGPEVLEVREEPAPEPGAGQVLVDVEAVGVNYRDIYEREGYGGYSSPTYDRLFAEYSTTLDPEKSQSLLADMMKLAHEDVAAIPMYYAALGLAYRNVVVGPGAVAPNQAANAWNIHDWELKPGGA